ncbi:MAG: response regulator [Rhodocyclaceae bacterium]|nr:response regulator [Rhodocyclaceae bacterium]MCO5112482.1 response regulator [Burkholderiaceae bacterium]
MNQSKRNPQCKVLLVDDDRLVLATLTSGLEEAGYAVQACASAEEAWRVIGLERPDIAVLDVRMPGQSGLELAKQFQEHPGLPFIFLTAYGDEDIVREAIAHGALGYLVKPVDIHQLIPAIEAAVARAADLWGLRNTERQLQTALNENREVSMAVGLLVERRRISRQQAFDALRATARTQRRKIGEVAEEILSAAELLNVGKQQ